NAYAAAAATKTAIAVRRVFTLTRLLLIVRCGRGRINPRFVPVFLDQSVFDANHVEVIPIVFLARLAPALVLAVPHEHYVRSAHQRQRGSVAPFRLDLLRSAA